MRTRVDGHAGEPDLARVPLARGAGGAHEGGGSKVADQAVARGGGPVPAQHDGIGDGFGAEEWKGLRLEGAVGGDETLGTHAP